jgi:ABC-type dipeptide/oligopeptide/nickel transport system permease component
MQRFKFILYRPIQLLPVLFGISLVTFVLVHALPGDPVRAFLGPRRRRRRSSGSAPSTGSIGRCWCNTSTSSGT